MIFLAHTILSCAPEEKSISSSTAYPPHPQIRLLSRREYKNTLASLLEPVIQPCDTDADCDNGSCLAQQCVSDSCSKHTFLYSSDQERDILLSGNFNGWAQTEESGAWRLHWNASNNTHILKINLPALDVIDDYYYHLIVDGQIELDPNANQQVTINNQSYSVLSFDCATDGRWREDPTEHFPIESYI